MVYQSPRYRSYDGYRFPSEQRTLHLLDRETGVVSTLPMTETGALENVECSPWRDDAGRFRLVGRWIHRRGGGLQALSLAVGLACCRFPGGKIVDRIPLDPVPTSNPCWYPDGSGRVLFPEGGQLYSVTFRGKDTAAGVGPEEDRQVRPVNWSAVPPGCGVDFIRDLHWPSDGTLSLRCLLLASMTVLQRGAPAADRGWRLWWLDLGRDGTEIVAAGQLIAPDPTEPLGRRAEERFPVLGPTRDGKAMLAYLAREHDGTAWELWLTPVALHPAGTARSITSAAGRRVAGDCVAAAPAFSADGQWVYVLRHSPCSTPRLERFPVAEGDDALSRLPGIPCRVSSWPWDLEEPAGDRSGAGDPGVGGGSRWSSARRGARARKRARC
jgi:hypothetical protein